MSRFPFAERLIKSIGTDFRSDKRLESRISREIGRFGGRLETERRLR